MPEDTRIVSTAGTRMQWTVVLMLLGAFGVGTFFFGVGVNFVLLVLVAALLLAALTMLAPSALPSMALERRAALALAALALFVLVVNVQLSVSKDSSFAPAWVLAALPLSFVATRSLGADFAQRLVSGLTCVIVAFAAISLARLALFGERAGLPLTDPNNYATLMYLAWIPFVHRCLVRSWKGPIATRDRVIEIAASFALLGALIATQSRTGVAIAASMLVVWFMVAVVKRRSLMGPLLHVAIAGVAFALVVVLTRTSIVAERVATVGAGIDVRLDLLGAALRMYLDYPFRGVGVFCFSLMYSAYRPLTEQLTAGLFVHDDYVQLLAEGGWLLALLPVALAVAAARAALRGVRAGVDDAAFLLAGPALAVLAACAHALVNFVFYTLPLALVIGTLAACMTAAPAHGESSPRPRGLRAGIFVAVAFGWVAWLYLVLDLVTVAVFQGQRGVPFSDLVRSDPTRQLGYARLAERLNGERGVPALAEAMILARGATSGLRTDALAAEAASRFRRAIEVDPWNPLGYIAFSDFVRTRARSLATRPGEDAAELLLKALSIDPTNTAAIDRLLDLNRQRGRQGDSYAVLRNVVFPRLELLKRQDEDAANRYLNEATRLATLAGDSAFLAAIEQMRPALARVSPKVYPRWFE